MLSESFYLKLVTICKNLFLSLVVVRLVIFLVIIPHGGLQCTGTIYNTDDLFHALLLYPDNMATADHRPDLVHVAVPDLPPDKLRRLDFGTELGEADVLPL